MITKWKTKWKIPRLKIAENGRARGTRWRESLMKRSLNNSIWWRKDTKFDCNCWNYDFFWVVGKGWRWFGTYVTRLFLNGESASCARVIIGNVFVSFVMNIKHHQGWMKRRHFHTHPRWEPLKISTNISLKKISQTLFLNAHHMLVNSRLICSAVSCDWRLRWKYLRFTHFSWWFLTRDSRLK